eukprot:GHVS01098435.1.p1 GENE.GHVS01098435.1~~GHVS01098435.1.p1  ORF type:complete len:485 (+),score=117.49 GHVS01098435.1:164-1618(+)
MASSSHPPLWCRRVLPCGHLCGGTDGEWQHEEERDGGEERCIHNDELLPSTNSPPSSCSTVSQQLEDIERAERAVLLGLCICNICRSVVPSLSSSLDYSTAPCCPICLETLPSLPSLKLPYCGHVFHYSCLLKHTASSSTLPTEPLDFSCLCCPQCRAVCVDHPCLWRDEKIRKQMELRLKVFRLALLQSRREGISAVGGGLVTTGEEAMTQLTFYMCSSCLEPFYGGHRECADNRPSSTTAELPVCCRCSSNSTCKKHGNGGINFKCRFCCNVASWFCFGTTHYCTSCHSQSYSPPTIACPGASTCPLRIAHPHNPCEVSLGCSVCCDELLLGRPLPSPLSAEAADQVYVQEMHSKIAQEALKNHWEEVNKFVGEHSGRGHGAAHHSSGIQHHPFSSSSSDPTNIHYGHHHHHFFPPPPPHLPPYPPPSSSPSALFPSLLPPVIAVPWEPPPMRGLRDSSSAIAVEDKTIGVDCSPADSSSLG